MAKAVRTLRAIHPNAGIAAQYRKRLIRMIDDMGRSYAYWLRAAYRANEPEMAMDATPAVQLKRSVDKMSAAWQARFDKAAPKLARYFATDVLKRSDASLKQILRDGGWSVKFTMTPAMKDVFRATVEENVSLIKSIPQQFHTKVQGLVMRSVQQGRDLSGLTKELQAQFGVTRRRAELIALDQNNKATSALQRARQTELGIEKGVWMHSKAGREPRPTHLANDGKVFDIKAGWFDPDPKVRRRIMPGELINCRCTWKPEVKGFS